MVEPVGSGCRGTVHGRRSMSEVDGSKERLEIWMAMVVYRINEFSKNQGG